jgi:predicted ATPase/DNA-binding winged helix-turn-helix (wHTH) protein
MAGVTISVLGPLGVVDRATGQPVVVSRGAHRRLLAILALAGGRRVSTEVLIDRFWVDGPPASAKTALQTHISAVRRILPANTIVTEGHGYALAEGTDIDAVQLGELAADAHRHRTAADWESALDAASAALERWGGEPYEDVAGDEFALAACAAVTEQRASMEGLRIEALIELHRHDEALPHAEVHVREFPLREHAWELLARGRAAAGRYAEALRAIGAARSELAAAGLEPGPGLRGTEQQILLDQQRSVRPRHNLPTPASTFVGRSTELRDMHRFLCDHRLVTVTGVGGAGKSRFALEIARDAMAGDTLGIGECWLVELAAEHDAAGVAARVADALGITTPNSTDIGGAIARALHDCPALIVLDNCEHVLTGAARVAHLLVEAGPQMRVLVTSRIPLGVPGELVVELPPLDLPEGEATPDDEAAPDDETIRGQADAVKLFVERAQLSRPGIEFTEAQLAIVGRLCRHLDGLPLAIELAAGRLRTIGLDVIADRASDRLHLLTGGAVTGHERHRTMASTIAWSFDLLDPAERALLTGLAVFRGAVGVAAIEGVCVQSEDHDLDARLDALVTQPLVSLARSGGSHRYGMLGTVREYAWSQLESVEDRERLMSAHREYFVGLAKSLRIHWVQPPEQRMQPTAVRWWIDERVPLDDVRAALRTSRELGSSSGVADLAGMLAHVAAASLRHLEAIDLLEEALGAGAGPRLVALLRSLLATQLAYVGEMDRAVVEIDRAVDLVVDTPTSLAKISVLARSSLLSFVLPSRSAASALEPALAALVDADELDIDVVLVRIRALVVTAYARAGRVEDAAGELERLRVDAHRARDPAGMALAITAGLNVVYVGGKDRRSGGGSLVAEALEVIDTHPDIVTSDLGFITMTVLMQLGRYDEAEAVLAHLTGDRYEGYEQTGARAVRARLRWFQGRFDEASAEISRAIAEGVELSWEHHVCSIGAEVAAARMRLDETRAYAAELLERECHPTRAVYRTAVLRPLVQAEVDAALLATGHDRARHAAAARVAAVEIDAIGSSLPAGAHATTQIERWTTYLALADAELARLDGPRRAADAWRSVVDVPDTMWYRNYASRRAVEAERALAGRA